MNKTPICRCCGKELNTLHSLACRYVKTHYDLVTVAQTEQPCPEEMTNA